MAAPGGRDTVNPHRSHAFGMYAGDNRLYLLTHLNNRQLDQLPRKSCLQNLDVSVLHTLIIEKHLGICGELRARPSTSLTPVRGRRPGCRRPEHTSWPFS